ncbi:hypothetical protein BKA93DRAFT_927676, partial [Sparassis latifolia]
MRRRRGRHRRCVGEHHAASAKAPGALAHTASSRPLGQGLQTRSDARWTFSPAASRIPAGDTGGSRARAQMPPFRSWPATTDGDARRVGLGVGAPVRVPRSIPHGLDDGLERRKKKWGAVARAVFSVGGMIIAGPHLDPIEWLGPVAESTAVATHQGRSARAATEGRRRRRRRKRRARAPPHCETGGTYGS